MQPQLLILGMGYTASYVALEAHQLGFEIHATSRQTQKKHLFQSLGYTMLDAIENALTSIMKSASHVLITAPPHAILGDPFLNVFKALHKQRSKPFQWVGYLSSTGVYGDHQGAWVDETTPINPITTRSIPRFQAEQDWCALTHTHDVPLYLFRLAGIYGPERNALEDRIAGKTHSIVKEGQYFSRIHVADIAHILTTSMQQPIVPGLYNLADDEPCGSDVVDDYAAQLLHRAPLPRIHYLEAPLSPMAQSFYQHNRRINNQKIKKALGLELKYPTHREGLKQLYDEKAVEYWS